MTHDDHVADALDRYLTACLTEPTPALPNALPPEESTLAAALVQLAHHTEPNPTFAAALEAQVLEQAAPAKQRPSAPPRAIPRWLPWAAVLLLALVGLLAVPPIRAGVLEVLQIGAVRIRLAASTPTVSPPAATPVPRTSALGLAGETSLEAAEEGAGFPVQLPTYPADLGPPDQVFLQQMDGPLVVLVWLDEDDPQQVRLSLHHLASSAMAEKGGPSSVLETTVNGRRAVWSTGPYPLQYRRAGGEEFAFHHLVTGHVLIWQVEEGGVTYRLETELSLDEARRIAESLR